PASRGALFKTIDGGRTLAVVDSGQTKYTSIFFLNKHTGWIATNNVDSGGAIMRTDDGGKTWTSPGATLDWHKMYFADSLNGWGIYLTNIGKTTDGGKTWSVGRFMDPPAPSSGFKGLFFKNSTTGWAVGSSGFILKTNDSGESWKHLDSRLDIFYGALDDVVFTDENEGWIVGWQLRSDPEPDSSIVLHTIDGGLTWERQSAPYNSAIRRIRAIDNQKLWAIGGPLLFFTTDGGQNWHRSDFQAEEGMFREIFFMDELNGILLSDRTIYKTSDGGSSWSKLANISGVQFLRRLVFTDRFRGWVLGKNAVAFPTYKTTDGGQSWHRSQHEFTAITFLDSLIGFAIQNGSVYRSLDGGNDWKQISENPASFATWTSNMTFSDSTHGWIWNYFNVYHTNDGGRTWKIENGISRIENVFPGGLFMLNKDLGWAVGSDGWIFKYESDDITSVSNTTVNGPSDFRLFQNYPNPFNPTTTINYFLPFREEIEISVFNVLGKKVKVLFSGKQNPGLHQIEFNGSDLSSGVYFYQLRAKSFVETKKSLLIK
ncbi:MAG: YCF48-related protein, partial [bacterium]